MLRIRVRHRLTLSLLLTAIVISGCGGSPPVSNTGTSGGSGARSGMIVADSLVTRSMRASRTRNASLLGIFVSNFVATSPVVPVSGAMQGIETQNLVMERQETVSDPDYDLIQAFADALQVDVLDLLNRSLDRQATLDAYIESLNNIAERANGRLAELAVAEEIQADEVRRLDRERSQLQRDVRNATGDKDFLLANEKQKLLSEKEREYSDAKLTHEETNGIIEALEELLAAYGEKILAIQENREPLIAGTKVIDLPGTLDLRILERRRGTRGWSNRFTGTATTASRPRSSSSAAQSSGSSVTNDNDDGSPTDASSSSRSATSSSRSGTTANRSSSLPATDAFGRPIERSQNTASPSSSLSSSAAGPAASGRSSSARPTSIFFGNPYGGNAGSGATHGAAGDFMSILEGEYDTFSINELVSYVVALALIIGLFLSVIYILIGGIKFIVAAGNEEGIKKAGATVRYAIIGLVVCLLGYFIVWGLAKLMDIPFNLSFDRILDFMDTLFSRFNQPLE